MAVKTVKVGPGRLTIGASEDLMVLESQVRSCAVEPEVDTEDPVPVLSGEFIAGKVTETFKLTGTFLQDLDTAAGVTEYTWDKAGTEQPFEFVPSTAKGKAVKGTIVVASTKIGGDVGENAEADFEFSCVGKPTIGTPTVPEG